MSTGIHWLSPGLRGERGSHCDNATPRKRPFAKPRHNAPMRVPNTIADEGAAAGRRSGSARPTRSSLGDPFVEDLGGPGTQPSAHVLHLAAADTVCLVLPVRPTVDRPERLGEVVRFEPGVVLRRQL